MRVGLRVCVSVLLGFFVALNALAQTQVSGSLSTNAQWTVVGGPYQVVGDVSVLSGATLTIDPGVTVYMTSDSSLTLQGGTLNAIGTLNSPVRILSDKIRQGQEAAPGDWRNLTFKAGSDGSRLEHVQVEHGRGVVVQGASPVFNYLALRNHAGAAMVIDLGASPSGSGNEASGNTINGISVPAGDITGNVKWLLRGIPYVVAGGTVSVGVSPLVTSVSPIDLQQGQATNVTINGAKLDALSQVFFSQAGLAGAVFSGGSGSQRFAQVSVPSNASLGPVDLRLTTDSGDIFVPGAFNVIAPKPAIASISPQKVFAGEGPSSVTVNGQNFLANSEVMFNSAPVATQFVGATQLVASLPVQSSVGALSVQVRNPDTSQPVRYTESNALTLGVELPVPPVVSFEPTPIAVPPDNRPRRITLRLSKPDFREQVVSLSVLDPIRASVSPASLTFAPGATTAEFLLTPLVVGTTSIQADSPLMGRVSVPLFVTTDFGAVNTAYSAPVGVVVEQDAGPPTQSITLSPAPVGVTVGGALIQAAPNAWTLGSQTTLSISGLHIPADATVSLVPSTGIALGSPVVNAEGTSIQVAVDTAIDAPVGARRVVVRSASMGLDLLFADWSRSMVQVVAGVPSFESVDPIFALQGTKVKFLVRGKNLQQGQLVISPASGLEVDSSVQVSADGTSLTGYINVMADAAVGPRTVQVVTPAGATSSETAAHNTLQIVSAVNETVTPVMSAAVGVVVGVVAQPVTQEIAQTGSLVGVLLGSGVKEVSPNVGVINTDVTVTVKGQGLQGVTDVSFVPSAGLTLLGVPVANEAGTELTFVVQIAEDASLELRRLKIVANGLPVVFSRPSDSTFLVSAPVPILASVTPPILLAGQTGVTVTVRGANLRNVQSVSSIPLTDVPGLTFSGPFTSNADGTELTFKASATDQTPSGEYGLVVLSAAGSSVAEVSAGNMVRVARELGSTYTAIASQAVGVVVTPAEVPGPVTYDAGLFSQAVGVVLSPQAVEPTEYRAAHSAEVGVLVGAGVDSVQPNGWLRGASGQFTVTGHGLSAATSAVAVPATGLILGAPVVNEAGTSATVSVSVAPDAAETLRGLRLVTAEGMVIPHIQPVASIFGIGSLPTAINSMSPINLSQGGGFNLVVRGSNLAGVIGVQIDGGAGVRAVGVPVWSQDALGELLTIPMAVDQDAPVGARVIRLNVHGGQTSGVASPANSVTVTPAL